MVYHQFIGICDDVLYMIIEVVRLEITSEWKITFRFGGLYKQVHLILMRSLEMQKTNKQHEKALPTTDRNSIENARNFSESRVNCIEMVYSESDSLKSTRVSPSSTPTTLLQTNRPYVRLFNCFVYVSVSRTCQPNTWTRNSFYALFFRFFPPHYYDVFGGCCCFGSCASH